MMTRTQLSIEPRMLREARGRASQLGISLAEYVRRLIAEDLGGRVTSRDPTAVFDLGTSSDSDVASRKDTLIAEAMAEGQR